MKAVITGGSSGIGLALAKNLSQRGNEVYSFDTQEPLEKLPRITHVQVDVSDSPSVKAGLKQVGDGIDILVNNAGIIRRGTLFDSSEEDFDQLFKINVKGSWLMIKEARQYLSGKPTIVIMSSGHALNPPKKKDPAVYTWTKQALAVLADTLRRDYPEYKIKAIFPGPVDTPMTQPHERDICHSAEYVASKIVELIDDPQKIDLVFDETSWDYVYK